MKTTNKELERAFDMADAWFNHDKRVDDVCHICPCKLQECALNSEEMDVTPEVCKSFIKAHFIQLARSKK